MTNRRAMIGFILAAIIFRSIPGCIGWLIGSPFRFQYVLDKGNSETVGKWTLKQTDAQKISDGIKALRYKMITTQTEGDDERRHAAEWLRQVVEQIENWPEDRVTPAGPRDYSPLSNLIAGAFSGLAQDAFDHPISEELLLRLKPDENHARWLGEWEESVATLRKSQQEGRDIAAGMPANEVFSR